MCVVSLSLAEVVKVPLIVFHQYGLHVIGFPPIKFCLAFLCVCVKEMQNQVPTRFAQDELFQVRLDVDNRRILSFSLS